MNQLEETILETLIDLKENHHVVGVKAEFETEGATLEDAKLLKDMSVSSGLDFTIKIGGCGAVRDIYEAKDLGVASIVAPMIESPYAAEKYLNMVEQVFTIEERKNIKFLINVETKNGFNYLEDVLNLKCADKLFGIVLGRTDFALSLGMNKDDVNNDIIFEYADKISRLALKYGKEMTVGGGISALSIPFFKRLPNSLKKFETRKIIFDAQAALTCDNADKGIIKALNFELMWLKNKQNIYSNLSYEDNKRIEILQKLILEKDFVS